MELFEEAKCMLRCAFFFSFLFFNFGVFCFRLCEGGSAVLCGDGELDRLN